MAPGSRLVHRNSCSVVELPPGAKATSLTSADVVAPPKNNAFESLVAVATSTAFFRCVRFFPTEDAESRAMLARGKRLGRGRRDGNCDEQDLTFFPFFSFVSLKKKNIAPSSGSRPSSSTSSTPRSSSAPRSRSRSSPWPSRPTSAGAPWRAPGRASSTPRRSTPGAAGTRSGS